MPISEISSKFIEEQNRLQLLMVIHEEDRILEDIGKDDIQGKVVGLGTLQQIRIDLNDHLLSVMHFNIRSLNKNIDNLIIFLETYKLYYIDIIVLSETFQIDSIENCNIPEYQIFYNHAKYNKNDGTIILVKKHINVDFSYSLLPNAKATISRIKLQMANITIGLTATYKPPPISKLDFVNDLHAYLEPLTCLDIEIFTGDINIDILNDNDNQVINYIGMMNVMGFQAYINSVTRPASETCLDHIFVKKKINSNKINIKSYIVEEDITDHNPIMLFLNQEKVYQEKTNHQETILKSKLNILKFKQLLGDFDWSCVKNGNDPESATDLFLDIYQRLLKEATETRYVKIKNYKKIKSWITNGIVTSIKTRDRMKKKLSKNYDEQLEKQYKEYRNALNKLIKKQKNDFYKHKIEINKDNIRKLYTVIRDATYENESSKNLLNIKDNNGQQFIDQKEMANYCNNYFINIGIEMEKEIPQPRAHGITETPVNSSIYLRPVTQQELIKSIASLKNNSSPGHDNISARIIKDTHAEITDPLLHLLNLILETGIVPTQFKISIVTPIHKADSRENIKHYRPISLITNFAKLLEKSLKSRLIDFMKHNKILSHNQFGFLENTSTVDAMHKLVSEVVNNLNNNKKCLAIFLDLAKAFDTVPHEKLLDVLYNYGIRGIAHKLFKNYLSNRLQMVKLNDILSDKQQIKIGIPQGTVVGPILFITYINSLLKLPLEGVVVSYADDTSVVVSGDNWEIVREKSINCFKLIKNWLQAYKLTLNLLKTNYIAFSLNTVNRPLFDSIVIDDQIIRETASTKYLGIIIDKYLKWQPQIEYLSNRIRKLIHKFYLLREFLNKKYLILVYKAFIETIIRYGIVVWGGLYNNRLHKLNIIQKYILKIIFKKNRLYPSHLLFDHDICNVRSMYILAACTFVHKSPELQNVVNHKHDTRTRANNNLRLPISNNNLNLKYINYLGPKIYNLLPLSTRQCRSLKTFKILSKDTVLRNYHQFGRLFD